MKTDTQINPYPYVYEYRGTKIRVNKDARGTYCEWPADCHIRHQTLSFVGEAMARTVAENEIRKRD